MCIVRVSRGQWYKVHYLCFPALCGCMYPGWMKRKMKCSVVTARGEGLRNEKSTQAGPVLPHTHSHTETHTCTKARQLPPFMPPPIPCHLLAYLKVTCRRGWMCGLQPLKCPHEAKELFVSFRVTEPGVTETGDSCRWAVFIITGRPFVSVERKHSCRMKYIWYMKENIKVGPLDGNFSWEALIQKKSLKRSTQAELVWQVNVVFRPLPWIPRSRLSNTAANFCHNMSFSL